MLNGKCGCGAVSYTMKTRPIVVHCCHCTDCQRLTGSAFVLNAILEADQFECDGPVQKATFPTPSGKGQTVTRCAECGVAVFSSYLVREGKLRYIRVGTLDDPAACPPDVHIFTSTKLPWVELGTQIPAFEKGYDFSKVLSPESRARWRTLFG
jgi:hypothetical protein